MWSLTNCRIPTSDFQGKRVGKYDVLNYVEKDLVNLLNMFDIAVLETANGVLGKQSYEK